MIDQANLGGRALHRYMIRCQDGLINRIIFREISIGVHDQ